MEPRRREGSPVAAVMQDARQQVEVTIKDSDAGAESAAAELGTLFREALQLHQAGRLADAVQLYQQALRLHPGAMGLEALGHDAFGLDALGHDAMRRGAICCNLGHALLGLYKRSEALVVCRQAVMLLPESVEALANLGNVLLELGRIEEARAAYEAALGKNPEWLPAIHNLGTVLMEEGRFNAALEVSERVLTLDPHFADARLNRGILRLLHGEFAEGWEDYEARLQVQRTMTPRLSGLTPQWRGEPLAGDSILLYAEQGLGDAIQFLRYVPPVAEAGGEVTLVLPARLVRMAEGMQVRVIAEGELLPECRWQCPLMSLPLALAARGGGWGDSGLAALSHSA